MVQVTILRRESTVRVVAPGQVRDVVAVTYSSTAVPPRTVDLPPGSYRDASAEELDVNPRYQVMPVGEGAEEAEREAIRQDRERVLAVRPSTFDIR